MITGGIPILDTICKNDRFFEYEKNKAIIMVPRCFTCSAG